MTARASRWATDQPRARDPIEQRALLLWPRLDRRALARCRHDLEAITRLVGRRTSLPRDSIRALLAAPVVSGEDRERWFG
jgi:hypothetical protein